MRERDVVLALVRLVAEPSGERRAAVRTALAGADLDRLLVLLARLRALGSLGGRLADDPELGLGPAPAARAQIDAARDAARKRGLLHLGATGALTRALAERGIPAVPLKGATLADAVHGDLGARDGADIDVLVPAGDLGAAVEVAGGLGWAAADAVPPDGLPRLHRTLVHPELPPLELHWRVHWYESAFAPAALDRAAPTEHGWLRLRREDELAVLLLALARDGFAGLRQTVDVAAWWAALGGDEVAAGMAEVAADHRALEPALVTAAARAEATAGIARGALVPRPPRLSARQRAALRLANPWLEGDRQQIDAAVSLVDGLLSPPGGVRPWVRRQLLPPDETLAGRDRRLAGAPRPRLRRARAGHAVRVLSRYVLELPRLLRPARR